MRRMFGEEDYQSDSSETEEDECYYSAPADAFLTGKAVRSEVKLKDLNPKDRESFDQSMAKEWSSWETPEQIATQIGGTRWVRPHGQEPEAPTPGKLPGQEDREDPRTDHGRAPLHGEEQVGRSRVPGGPKGYSVRRRHPSLHSTWCALLLCHRGGMSLPATPRRPTSSPRALAGF